MPIPVVDPMPRPGAACRLGAPLMAQEASYLAASASRASLRSKSMLYIYTATVLRARPTAGWAGPRRAPNGPGRTGPLFDRLPSRLGQKQCPDDERPKRHDDGIPE